MTAEQHQAAANPQTKTADLRLESAVGCYCLHSSLPFTVTQHKSWYPSYHPTTGYDQHSMAIDPLMLMTSRYTASAEHTMKAIKIHDAKSRPLAQKMPLTLYTTHANIMHAFNIKLFIPLQSCTFSPALKECRSDAFPAATNDSYRY